MVTMLDCIKRVPAHMDWILKHRKETFAPIWKKSQAELSQVQEIILIGSGTSSTSAITAQSLMERVSGLRVSTILPADYMYHKTIMPPHVLYVFISQTGTSAMTRQAIAKAKKQGGLTLTILQAADTPAAQEADLFINMGCGKEEWPMRTIGYSSSVMTLVLLAAELGRLQGKLEIPDCERIIRDAESVRDVIPDVIRRAEKWMDTDRRTMLRSDCLIFTGSGALAGVAMEASVKVWETPQITSFYYELEEGTHGPNFGYSHRHCIIVLNDGGVENDKAVALARYMKNEMNNGFMIGANTIDEHDLPLDLTGGLFECLQFAAAIQVVAYRLAIDQGYDLFHRSHGNMQKYFDSHKPLDIDRDEH